MPLNREDIIQLAGGNNEEAKAFCRSFVNWVHWIDDVLDKDVLWLPRDVVRVNLEMVLAFSDNSFFQSYKHQLMPLVLQASRAFGDSLKWARRESARDRQSSDVLKSFYHEVVWHVAYIVGGWNHLKAVTEQCREIDYDVLP